MRQIIRGEHILVGGNLQPTTILLENGIIHDVISGVVKPDGNYDEVIDAGDLVVMAGVVDSHVHVNEPGRAMWEGYVTATKAAAAGGITTLVDMPLNSIPPTTTLENFRTKLRSAVGKCYVDVGFWGGVVPGNTSELRAMVDEGVLGFKCFLIHSGVDEFPHVDESQVEESLRELEGTGSVLLFHAECDTKSGISDTGEAADPHQYSTFLTSRPPEMETTAIRLVIDACLKHNVRCHVVHLSAAAALPILKSARKSGAPLTVETCPHYLTLDAESIPDSSSQYKCCPPVREKHNQELLWAGLKAGVIDQVVSDHSPCTADLKQPGQLDFMQAWGGIASVQFSLPVFWSAARRRGFNLSDVCRLMCETPAKLCGLNHKKGAIKPGLDADFVIWDPYSKITVADTMIQYKNKLCPYMGNTLEGVVHRTIVRGHTVYKKESKFSDVPMGKFLNVRADVASQSL